VTFAGGIEVRHPRFVFGICATALLTVSLRAQTARPYDEVMKEVGSTYTTLKQNLDMQNPQSAQDAAKLQALFKEVEDFWARYDTRDAIEASQGAANAFAALAESVKVNNFQQALTTYTAAGRFCASCHSVHRVQAADQSYLIKP
jgi:hypothetical protein